MQTVHVSDFESWRTRARSFLQNATPPDDLIWEDAAGVNVALADANGPGPVTQLATAGGQGSLAVHAELGALAAWSAPDGRWRRITLAPLRIEGQNVVIGKAVAADFFIHAE